MSNSDQKRSCYRQRFSTLLLSGEKVMPVDPSVIAPVSSGDTVSAEDIRERFQGLEKFVNGGIEASDLKTGSDFTAE